MRGRKPTPTAQQIAGGDPRKLGANKLREKLDAEPQAASGFPECPEHIQGLAREAWYFLADQIEIMGIDKRPDAMMLEGACVNYARAVQADAEIARDGITVKESIIDKESGEVVVLKIRANPACAVSRQCWMLLKAFGSEFGLSPVSRTRLTLEKKDDGAAELAAILGKPREPKPAPVN